VNQRNDVFGRLEQLNERRTMNDAKIDNELRLVERLRCFARLAGWIRFGFGASEKSELGLQLALDDDKI
jgi:hypothetical protein